METSPGESTTARGTWLVSLRSGAVVFSRIPLLFLPTGTLANKVKRKDTLAIKLGTAAAPQEEKVVFPRKSKEEWNEIRHQIGTTLIRYKGRRRVLLAQRVEVGSDEAVAFV